MKFLFKHLKYVFTLSVCLSSLSLEMQAQSTEKAKNYTLGGYLKYLHTVQFEHADSAWLTDNILHNRINFKWYPNNQFTFTAEVRNRLFYGETVKNFPGYSSLIGGDNGFLDMSFIPFEGSSYFFHSHVDRLYLDWQSDKWQVRLGRQRINWGQCFVWNPNDVFNTYSFFDFDYEERPGADALLARYYTGTTSSIELAIAFAERFEDFKIMVMYRWNTSAYDFQVLAGKVQQDLALGIGWSGQIKTAGFKGEVTWFEPYRDLATGKGTVVASLSMDYTFKNSLFLHSEGIYNSNGVNGKPGQINYLNEQLSSKTLTVTQWAWFNEISYMFSPLIKGGVSSIYNPNDASFYMGPNVDISLSDNLYLLYAGQFFFGPERSQYDGLGYLNFLRLKWSF
ncbi:hypothetical protein AAG747_07320 [Rapidithrix thailandica]|uniref:Alginate export domain-containing protein n=1 Tax=Rapidithrix thailandica TaxID=413964 RepID=A0AAW9S3P4_9BACT